MLAATIKLEDFSEIRKANRLADLIELRLDLFESKNLHQLRQACKKPVIFKLNELNWGYLECQPDYVDLPASLAPDAFLLIRQKYPRIRLICSYHNYLKTPDLEEVLHEMKKSGADLYKLATHATSTLDALRMLQFVKKHGCIGLCMGELGTVSRLLSPVYGAPFTYAPITQKHETAPGQISVEDHLYLYQHKKLSSSTQVFGLIGDPVSKSLSHKTHNISFVELGIDAVYVKMCLKDHELSEFFNLCHQLGFSGLSVTMPLKEKVLPFLKDVPGDAINTIRFKDKFLEGCNTDGKGALNAIEKRMKVRDKTMVLLGAGGAAIGIAKEARLRGAKLIVINRTLEKAQKLATKVEADFFSLADFPNVAKEGYDILVNCTSVGMGDDKSCPVNPEDLLENKLVMDIISSPEITPLLAAAKRKNCPTIAGIEMFIQQAVLQFCFWFEDKLKQEAS